MNKKDKKTDIPPEKLLNYDEVKHACEMAIISDDPKIQKKAWDLLNRNDCEWPWMRMGILMEAYEAADAKGKLEFLMIGIDKALKNGIMHELKKQFVDSETGISYKQFKSKDGKVTRVPVVTPEMNKHAYDTALNKHFLGDVIEFMGSKDGQVQVVETYVLDTQEKVDDYNAGDGRWFQKWVVKNPNPKYFAKNSDRK